MYVNDADPGIRRRGSPPRFRYVDAAGKAISGEALARIRKLAIPPAYTDVWICANPRGHLQATGRDARGRKQYRYHPDWSAARGADKFWRVVAFGAALPKLRRRVRSDLAREGLPREKVLAVVVALLAGTLERVGNDEYARDNHSFGLTTLRDRHVAFLRGGRSRFRFRGKGGQEREVTLDDARLSRLLKHCQQLPGQALFQYRDDAGETQPIDSGQVNDYLREAMGDAFTAKDFRTWGATAAAFVMLAGTPLPEPGRRGARSERALAATERQVVCAVASVLGNTATVCRASYIDPAVFDGWRDGRLQRAAEGASGARQWERAVLRFLRASRRTKR